VRGRPGGLRRPPGAASPGLALAALLFFGQVAGHANFPLAAEGAIVRDVGRVEGFVVLEEVDEDAVDLVGGVDGGLDLGLAALNGVEEGGAEVGAVEGELVAEEVEGIAEEGVALFGHLAGDDDIAGDIGGGVHAGLGPNLVGEEDVVERADAGEVTGNEVGAGAWDGEQMAGGGVREQHGQVVEALLLLFGEEAVVCELALEDVGEGGGDVWRWQEGALDDGKDALGGFGAAAVAVFVEEVDDAALTKLEQVVGVGAEGDEGLGELAFEGAGGEWGGRRQVRMGAGETAGVEKGAGDELVEGGEDAVGDALLFGLDSVEGADFLAHEQVGGSREVRGEAQSTRQEVAYGTEVNQVGLIEGEGGLGAVEFDLVGVDEEVEEAWGGVACEVVGVARHQVTRPGFVVDAGRLVTEDDESRLALGHQRIEGSDVAVEAVLEGGDFDGLVEQEAIAGVKCSPVGVFADIERSDEDLVVGDAGGELAERFGPASLDVDQLLLFTGMLAHSTTSFGM